MAKSFVRRARIPDGDRVAKTANCQTLVSLTLACGEVPVMVALRHFLPDRLD
jgi:hypothetical protein